MIGLLIFGTIADLLLACVLVTVSGFIFGGPEGMSGDAAGVAMFGIGLIVCLGAPVAGFILRAHDKLGIGALLTWVPPIVAVIVTFGGPGR